jgi:hypothetical protein
MRSRVFAPLIALAAAACGQVFTASTVDGGALSSDGSILDTGVIGPDDGAADDGSSPPDATVEDAPSAQDAMAKEGGGVGKDGSVVIVDAGSRDASLCVGPCPAGFDCVVDKCIDRAAPHFSASNNQPFNWSYGYAVSLGGSFMLDTSHWSPGNNLDVWTNTSLQTLEPSVFHNSGLSQQMYQEMTIPGAALGLFPGANNEASIVRWTAPAKGSYAIDVTFTGISAPLTTVNTGVLVNNITGMLSSAALNEFGGGNTFTYSAPAQTLVAGDVVDFYVTTVFNRDDPPGGAMIDARITAE